MNTNLPKPVRRVSCLRQNLPKIDVEEDAYLSQGIVYAGDSDEELYDCDQLARRRAQKRRRVQQNITACLRGEGIFIGSAILEGQWDNSLRQPWGKRAKSRAGLSVGGRALCETIHDGGVPRAPLADGAALASVSTRCHQQLPAYPAVDSQSLRKPETTPWKSKPSNVAKLAHTHLSAQPSNGLPPVGDTVESWLRRLSRLPDQDPDIEPVSLTPVTNRPTISKRATTLCTPTKQAITVNSQYTGIQPQSPLAQRLDSTQVTISLNPNFTDSTATHLRLQDALGSPALSASTSSFDLSDFPVARSVSRMSRDQSDQQNELHAPKGRFVLPLETHEPLIKLGRSEVAIDKQISASLEPSQKMTQHVNERSPSNWQCQPAAPVLSSRTSVSAIPSAQPRSAVITTASSLSSPDFLAELVTITGPHQQNSIITDLHQIDSVSEVPVTSLFDKDTSSSFPQHNLELVRSASVDRIASSQPDVDSQLIAADFTKPTLSAYQLLKQSSGQKETNAPRRKAVRKTKSTSFAADVNKMPTTGSIKGALRVTKADLGTKRKPSSRASLTFEQSRVEENDNLNYFSRSKRTALPRGVLKSAMKSSSNITLSHAPDDVASEISLKHNRQRDVLSESPRAFYPNAGGDFDLDDALEDVGSFLSTWDTETKTLKT